ncbi:hypothetical protein [Algibacillus agarilyticus]|uniref:hypothetical protein n=1 Tax=Algibacillus agarilyticus TaxID=2234133 RepID=UPI0018E50ACC|nr:hypothetical protein [Algibacillus agarilyticus]
MIGYILAKGRQRHSSDFGINLPVCPGPLNGIAYIFVLNVMACYSFVDLKMKESCEVNNVVR